MPIDRPYRGRYEGYFNDRRSLAPKFSTSSRNTLLTPYHFGGGYGTEPRAPHNIATTDVGPEKYSVPTKHTPRAIFGSARRTDLWGNRMEDNRSTATPSPQQSVGRLTQQSTTPRRESHQATTPRAPGPQSYHTERSDFDLGKPAEMDRRILNAKFAREGVHTPRPYVAGSRGGAIPRTSRSTPHATAPTPTPGPGAYRPKYGLV